MELKRSAPYEQRRSAWSNVRLNWYFHEYPHKDADELVAEFFRLPKRKGWMRAAREASFISVTAMAKRLGISRVSYRRLETREAEGAITLARLEDCAVAMGCELIYAIRPKDARLYSDKVWSQFPDTSRLDRVQLAMYDSTFRFRRGWRRMDPGSGGETRWYISKLRQWGPWKNRFNGMWRAMDFS